VSKHIERLIVDSKVDQDARKHGRLYQQTPVGRERTERM